jgi:Protein of unknown function (DUF3047)
MSHAGGARGFSLLGLTLVLVATLAWGADRVVVEDWSAVPMRQKGIPEGWKGQSWGSPTYDFTVVDEDGRRALHLKSRGDSSTISKELQGRVSLKSTPVLEWTWKVVTLPEGGDARRKERDDEAGQIYVVWPRFPEAVRSQIIGYIWDSTAPVGTVIPSQKNRTVTYIVVRSGKEGLGQWLTERRNVLDDFKRVYDGDADPGALSLSIDSDDTRSMAEAYVGPIVFTRK